MKRASDPTEAGQLRKRAEQRLARQGSNNKGGKLEQELAVHRVELEMQNEQLRAAQFELEAWLDRYTQLFDFAPIGYATLTPEGKLLQMNHVGASLLGRPRSQVVGRTFKMFMAMSSYDTFSALLEGVAAEHLKKTCEVVLRTDTGEKTILRLTANDIPGTEPTILLAFEDITAQKRAEAALRRVDDELREADRRKDEFLAVLSHELRTPLSSLLLHGQLLQRGKLDDAGSRQAGVAIERAVKRQSRLVEDLLDVSRIVAGKLSFRRDDVNLDSIVRAAVDAVADDAKKRGIDLTLAIDPSIPQITGDPARLDQAVSNLLTNAVKFTPAEGRIEVTVARVEGQVRIQVHDTGAGIDPDFLPHIFERFSQADRTTTRAAGGLGLGLSIAHSIVQAHRGHLRAESPGRGKGSTFTILLPTTVLRSEAGSTSSSPPALEANIRGARLLLVEDDNETRATLTEVLELAGAHVREVPSAAAAMQVLGRFRPDLLLCDIAMPGEDGCSLLRRIRALGKEQGGEVRALALTAFAGTEARARTRAAGFEQHLVKPVDVDELLATVSGLLPQLGGPDAPAHEPH